MVLFNERRHRLHDIEVPEAIKGLALRLHELLETKADPFSAEICFRAWYRLTTHPRGRPQYPEPITWSLIEDYLKNGTINAREEAITLEAS